ncbi:DUF2958 domain-containing protein [Bradyrhizobium sp. CCGE-LA001]|uniref:DUF2958 domain-containing protein n=1 Tax=Bradyrhizobium sp. CCGE-LA001 TaxID=1223566 RepID=UPI0002FCE845
MKRFARDVGVWLGTELDSDGDTPFGLADLGEPELGSFSLAEMMAVRLPFDMGIEHSLRGHGPDFGLGRGRAADRRHPGGGADPLCRRAGKREGK